MKHAARLQRLEREAGCHEDIEGARALVRYMKEYGDLDEGIDEEKLISEYAAQGKTLRALLDEIDGTCKGLPGERIPDEYPAE